MKLEWEGRSAKVGDDVSIMIEELNRFSWGSKGWAGPRWCVGVNRRQHRNAVVLPVGTTENEAKTKALDYLLEFCEGQSRHFANLARQIKESSMKDSAESAKGEPGEL